MATGRVRPLWIPPDSGDPGLFTYGVDVVADQNQGVSGIWWYQPPAPGTVTNVTVGLYVQATQTLVPGASATLLVAGITAGAWNLALFAAPVTMTSGVTYTIVATASGESASENPAGYIIDDPSNTVHLTLGRFEAGAGPYPADSTWVGQHGVDIEMVEAEPIEGTLSITLPPITVDLDADADVSATMTLTVPVPQVDLFGNNVGGGGSTLPCSWSIPEPLCCDIWDTLSPELQAAAADYASTILWAATGRQFGLCEVTVRPCGMKRCQDGGAEFFGYDWTGGTWVPYIFNGVWFNCACAGMCCCDPRCQVRLMGPVAQIVEVTIGGVIVPDTSYRVDDGHWLVRTDGECWPQCSDMDSDDGDNVFMVTYLRGTPVPQALLVAAGTLECEFAKACSGADCRLSSRVTSLARNGVQIDMVDPGSLLDEGLTGIMEVDMLIRAYNPHRLKERGRIYAPELRIPRMTTSP